MAVLGKANETWHLASTVGIFAKWALYEQCIETLSMLHLHVTDIAFLVTCLQALELLFARPGTNQMKPVVVLYVRMCEQTANHSFNRSGTQDKCCYDIFSANGCLFVRREHHTNTMCALTRLAYVYRVL